MSKLSFLAASNAEYISHLYNQYLVNAENVEQDWREFFHALNDNEAELLRTCTAPAGRPTTTSRTRTASIASSAAPARTRIPSWLPATANRRRR